MPIKKNAVKALRQSKKRTLRNQAKKAAIKTAVKSTLHTLKTGGKDLEVLLRSAQKALDKAAKTGAIKKNAARRKISRLMKKANALRV